MELLLPASYRKMVLQGAHDGYLGGHLGIEKTTDKIIKSYFWPTLLKDVVQYVQTCKTCNMKKLNKERRPIKDMPMPSAPIDIMGTDKCGPGKTYPSYSSWAVTVSMSMTPYRNEVLGIRSATHQLNNTLKVLQPAAANSTEPVQASLAVALKLLSGSVTQLEHEHS